MPQYDKNDNVCGAFGIWLDITSRMNAREKLKHEMELANQSVRMKSMFMASLSHEIRTPLNSIVGFSEILHTIQDENERKQIFDIIDSNCDILLRLINDILAASDKETNLKIEPKDIGFVKCFKEICQVLKQRVDLSGVEFIMDSPCDEIRARLDIERLQQVLTNFVTNAVKYTKKGHIKVGYEFDGKILKEFYDTEEWEEMKTYPYVMWQEEKEKIFSLVKGKKTPLSFRFVMMLKLDLVSDILAKYNLAIREDEVAGLFINILYDRQGLKCTAGVSRKTFVLDKTLEEAWDQEVKERFLEFL